MSAFDPKRTFVTQTAPNHDCSRNECLYGRAVLSSQRTPAFLPTSKEATGMSKTRPRWIYFIPILFWIMPGGPALAQATSSIKCSNGTVTVSTGTNEGSCTKGGTVITCNGNGSSVGGGCDEAGKASCGNAVGSGTCTIAAVTPPKKTPLKVGGVPTKNMKEK